MQSWYRLDRSSAPRLWSNARPHFRGCYAHACRAFMDLLLAHLVDENEGLQRGDGQRCKSLQFNWQFEWLGEVGCAKRVAIKRMWSDGPDNRGMSSSSRRESYTTPKTRVWFISLVLPVISCSTFSPPEPSGLMTSALNTQRDAPCRCG